MEKSKYKPTSCPVCDRLYFGEWQEGDEYGDIYCRICGWDYNLEQLTDPTHVNPETGMTLEDYKQWYQSKLEQNPNYQYSVENAPLPEPHMCPVCGKYQFEDYSCFDICPYCGWEDDGSTEEDTVCGPNDLPLPQYRQRYEKLIAEDANYMHFPNFDPFAKKE